MRQRIVIAISLLTEPSLIIADEPTTALDVTIQAEIMDLLLELCQSDDMALILITHDLAVVSEVTQRIAVMYAGSIVETGLTSQVTSNPAHPYTKGLIAALPQSGGTGNRLTQIPPEPCLLYCTCLPVVPSTQGVQSVQIFVKKKFLNLLKINPVFWWPATMPINNRESS